MPTLSEVQHYDAGQTFNLKGIQVVRAFDVTARQGSNGPFNTQGIIVSDGSGLEHKVDITEPTFQIEVGQPLVLLGAKMNRYEGKNGPGQSLRISGRGVQIDGDKIMPEMRPQQQAPQGFQSIQAPPPPFQPAAGRVPTFERPAPQQAPPEAPVFGTPTPGKQKMSVEEAFQFLSTYYNRFASGGVPSTEAQHMAVTMFISLSKGDLVDRADVTVAAATAVFGSASTVEDDEDIPF